MAVEFETALNLVDRRWLIQVLDKANLSCLGDKAKLMYMQQSLAKQLKITVLPGSSMNQVKYAVL